MKKLFALLLLSFAVKLVGAQDKKITPSAGLAMDVTDLRWSIAGNAQGNSPNILSELEFTSVTSLGYFLEFGYRPVKGLELLVYYKHGKVVGGRGTDVDYRGDDRTDPSYDLSFSSNRGKLDIFRAGAKAALLKKYAIELATGLYYTSDVQNFYILSREEPDLESTYRTKMRGVELVIEAEVMLGGGMSSLLTFGGAYVNYGAEANWNLRDIFMHPLSFSQASNGIGMRGGLRFAYSVNPAFSLMLGGIYNRTKLFAGSDTSYLANGTEVLTRFNGADHSRYGLTIGVIVRL